MLIRLVCSALLLAIFLQHNVQAIPEELLEKMKDVKSMEDFKRVFEFPDDVETIKIPLSDEELSKRDILPEGHVINTTISTAPATPLSIAICRPYPTPMVVPLQLEDMFIYFPSHVMLHRCAGSCLIDPRSVYCAPTRQTDMGVLVAKAEYSLTKRGVQITKRNMVEVRVVNHTECGVACVAGSHMCEPNRTKWVQNKCRCECEVEKVNATCDHIIHKLDEIDCSCRCKSQATVCTDDKREWSEKTCQCECKQSIVKRCERKNKLLDESSCECYCAPYTCPPGQSKENYDCTCV
uniref:Toxin candidate TRINITY_DN16726_c0_g1_i1 n=1 Tax=Ceriantheomorphe brasiliensis TaxID=1048506 RepID=A0A7G7WZ70_9CNID|nr:toxin candidate TRINITY_DN16726_c0_g1_i1 [Ceriantheomorphe brasiliensis]